MLRTWKHNTEILPRVQTQLETLLEAYGKFQPVVYDTQGIRDDGSDLVLRYRPEGDDAGFELICFQVKSFDDLSKKTYMQELKAQRDDSFRKVLGMRHYYLLLCTDGKAHRDRIRNIMAEFRSADRTEVIEPAFAFTFLHHPKTRIDALVKRTMEAGDLVFRLASESLDLPSPSARALTVFMAVRSVLAGLVQFNTDQLLREATLRSIHEKLRCQQESLLASSRQFALEQATAHEDHPEEDEWDHEEEEPIQLDDFENQLAKDLELLETEIVERDSGSSNIILRTNQIHALSAVITDALARYEYKEEQLMSYMFSLLGVQD
jgi:hypothetical protein